AVFVVIGTGVGGAIFINGQIYKGAHLFGGEFGLMQNTNGQTLSINGTAVHVAERFSKKIGQPITGKELYEKKSKAICKLEKLCLRCMKIVPNLYIIFKYLSIRKWLS